MKDDVSQLINSLLRQTVKPSKIIIVSGSRAMMLFIKQNVLNRVACRGVDIELYHIPPDLKEHVGVRVGKAINAVLRREDLNLYDFILKIDADVRLLSDDYIERCLKLNADLVGLGYFMLIRTRAFLKLLNGRWPEVPTDDAYIMQVLKASGYRVKPLPPGLSLKRPGGVGSWRYYYLRGIYDLKIGFDPFHEVYAVIHLIKSRRNFLPLFTLLGYFSAILKGEKIYNFGKNAFALSVKYRFSKFFPQLDAPPEA
jgi:hypothetical protein